MNASTDVPVTITPEAAARVAELGMQKELEQMIAHVREVVADLVAIEVGIAERHDSGGEPGVRIRAYTVQPYNPEAKLSWNLSGWVVDTFPSRVLEHMNIFLIHGRPNAR
jgi:hypothetical protein